MPEHFSYNDFKFYAAPHCEIAWGNRTCKWTLTYRASVKVKTRESQRRGVLQSSHCGICTSIDNYCLQLVLVTIVVYGTYNKGELCRVLIVSCLYLEDVLEILINNFIN